MTTTKQNNNLIIFLTTTQSPHFEAMFYYANENRHNYNKIYFINIFKNIDYRHEYTWRNYHSFRVNISRKIRNGINKKIAYFIEKKYNNKKFIFVDSFELNNKCTLKDEIHRILETYSCTEYSIPFLRITKYTPRIINSIKRTARIVASLLNNYEITNKDEVLLFNGRLPIENTIQIELRKKNFNKFTFHECNNYQNKIYYMKHSLHRLDEYYEDIIHFYNKNKSKLLDKWLDIKKINFEKKSSIYITYFTSSNDEYKFTYRKPINQSKIIDDLLKLDIKNYKLKIRVHPNTASKDISVKRYWNRLKELYPNNIVNYDEDTSSYELCLNSLFTISIGSSIAAESLILGVPHVLIGNQSWYNKFPGYLKCSDENYIKFIEDILDNKEQLSKRISFESKEYAVATQLFLKVIGNRIKITILGSYPTPDNFKPGIE